MFWRKKRVCLEGFEFSFITIFLNIENNVSDEKTPILNSAAALYWFYEKMVVCSVLSSCCSRCGRGNCFGWHASGRRWRLHVFYSNKETFPRDLALGKCASGWVLSISTSNNFLLMRLYINTSALRMHQEVFSAWLWKRELRIHDILPKCQVYSFIDY